MPLRDAKGLSLLGKRGQRKPSIAGAGLSSKDAIALLTRIVEAQGAIAASGPEPLDIMAAITQRAQELTRADGAVLEIRDGDSMLYWAASGTADAQLGMRIPVSGSLSGLCLERRRVLRCDDSELDDRVDRDACRRVGLRSMLVAPLEHRNEPVGVLKVVSAETFAFDAADAHALEHLSVLVGASMHGAIEESKRRDQAAALRDEAYSREVTLAGTRLMGVLARGQLRIARQPIVRLDDGTVAGWEALARFPEEFGLPTNRWFEDAALCGRSVELELASVIAALAGMGEIAGEAYLAVNVSPEVACSDAFAAALEDVDPARLVLEITEHTAVDDYAQLAARLLEFQQRGFRIAIDDTGAGFSSLRHVLSLAPDIIKLDMTLVRGIDRQPRLQALVAALRTFAEGTGALLVAEGIETSGEQETLQRIGVLYGQGYHLGKPR